MSISENRGFYAPIYYEKIDVKDDKIDKEDSAFKKLESECNIFEREDIPEIVLSHLDDIPPSLFG